MAGRTAKTGKNENKKEPQVNWVAQDIKAGELKQIYLLYGEEAELKRLNAERLLHTLGADGDQMNYNRYEGKAAEAEAIIEIADTMPFFAERRTICVKDSGLFKTKQDALADYLEHMPETSYLVFIESEVDRKLRLYKAVERLGRTVEYRRLQGQALKGEVARRLSIGGYKIRESTMDYLLEQTGSDLTGIQNQLDKLCAYAMGREEITREDVDAVVTDLTERETFLLTGAVADRDRRAALRYYYALMSRKAAEPMGILTQLGNLFTLLLQVKELRLKGEDDRTTAARLHIHPGRLYFLKSQSEKRSREELAAVLRDCMQAQEDIIRRGMDDRITLELLLIRSTADRAKGAQKGYEKTARLD